MSVLNSAKAQWTTGTGNVNNTNTGYIGISTALYVTNGGYLYGSLPAGSAVFGQGPVQGVYIPAYTDPGFQHYIKLDQPNNQVLVSNGNSDGGGGFYRGISGETRVFSNNSYSGSNYLTFFTGGTERARFNGNGNFGIGTNGPLQSLSVNSVASPTNSQFGITTNGGVVGLTALAYTADNTSLGFDLDFTSGAWIARNSTVAWLYKDAGKLEIMGSGGNTYGGAATQNRLMSVNLTSGNISIGTDDSKGYKFAVNGTAIATAMTVKLYANWPDYVFKPDYHLPPLSEVKTYIDKNKHLPDMPSEKEVAENGINLGEMNKLLTKKVEELTLYLIEKDKIEKSQQSQIDQLTKRLDALSKSIRQN